MKSYRESGGTSDRRSFLRRAGVTIAAGLGLALVPISQAMASVITCCREGSASCPSCPGSDVKFICQCSGGGNPFCICHQPTGGCFQHGGC